MDYLKIRHQYLDGVTLASILDILLENYSFDELAQKLSFRCFENNPSKKSALTFLRKTPWAREKIEDLYVEHMRGKR
jgi:uncharacterized protein (DUF2132 family)